MLLDTPAKAIFDLIRNFLSWLGDSKSTTAGLIVIFALAAVSILAVYREKIFNEEVAETISDLLDTEIFLSYNLRTILVFLVVILVIIGLIILIISSKN